MGMLIEPLEWTERYRIIDSSSKETINNCFHKKDSDFRVKFNVYLEVNFLLNFVGPSVIYYITDTS